MLTEPFTDHALVFATEGDLTPTREGPLGTFGASKSDVQMIQHCYRSVVSEEICLLYGVSNDHPGAFGRKGYRGWL